MVQYSLSPKASLVGFYFILTKENVSFHKIVEKKQSENRVLSGSPLTACATALLGPHLTRRRSSSCTHTETIGIFWFQVFVSSMIHQMIEHMIPKMSVMDGREATRLIRLKEKDYGVHIPISHAQGEEQLIMLFVAGIEIYTSKPLNKHKMLKLIQDLQRR
ncbi:hypothetical protein L2E82_13273 [Cichorium intybus]|uniref:Uncharacterized protein n=1 Tax=Cichorium intybus TaxID=13427 RepID=A0ACB9GJ60_CICIN|nr:hypothetical protein L2E82_13273 [Cichorium intybus]